MSNKKRGAPERTGVVDNPWSQLRAFTDARIGLGRAGISLPTHELLAFQCAHAQARDAVHFPLDLEALDRDLTAQALPWSAAIRLHSQAAGRTEYLQRPDLGRRLDSASRTTLQQISGHAAPVYDLALVVVDGLSSRAIQDNAVPFLKVLDDTLNADRANTWRLAPLTVVSQGRVAVGDEVGELLNAKTVVVLVGERPGLSSPDSLGLYLTWGPKTGRADSERNCISNVRPAGLASEEAVRRLMYLLRESRQLGLSGVGLKDRTSDDIIEHHQERKVFLLS